MNLNPIIIQRAYQWEGLSNGQNFLNKEELCETQDIFQARLGHFRLLLEKSEFSPELIPLLVAIAGEIGNNSFDHNLGNWPDAAGIYFVYDLKEKLVVLADRGQGIRRTISRIKPDIPNDLEALRIAFTEIISGRSPEQRGNGLKFVVEVIIKNNFSLYFHSGEAKLEIETENQKLDFKQIDFKINGCLAVIKF